MRKIGFAAAMLVLGVSPGFAADDVMAGFYGNTAVATGGMVDTHTTYSADHTFDMRVPSYHVEFKGSWKIDGATLCRTFDSPPPGMDKTSCVPMAAHKVGDTWTVTVGSNTRTITLVKGIQ